MIFMALFLFINIDVLLLKKKEIVDLAILIQKQKRLFYNQTAKMVHILYVKILMIWWYYVST